MLLGLTFSLYNKHYYNAMGGINKTIEELDTTQEDFDLLVDTLIKYFSNKSDKLQVTISIGGEKTEFFKEDELSHMQDAKNAFNAAIGIGIACLALAAAGIVYLLLHAPKIIAKGLITGNLVYICILVITGIIAAVFFEPIFILFHQIFFPQGNWNFGYTNMMIFMQENLFLNAMVIVVATGVLFAASSILLGVLLIKKEENLDRVKSKK